MLTLPPNKEHLVDLAGFDEDLVELRKLVVKVSYDLGSQRPRALEPQEPIEKRYRSDAASKVFHDLHRHFSALAYNDYIRDSRDRMSLIWNVWNDFSARLRGGFMSDGPQRNAWWTTLVSTDHEFLLFIEILTDLQAKMIALAGVLSTEAAKETSMTFIATLLALTPELILERIRLVSPTAACPTGLKRRSWERPELFGEIRYAPPRSYPALHELHHALPWASETSNDTIRGTIEYMLHRMATTHVEDVDSETVYTAIERSLQWLLEPVVEAWYSRTLRPEECASFSLLVMHLLARALHVVHGDGPYIGLSFLLLVNPFWVEGWMMQRHPDSPSHQGAPPFPGSGADPTPYAQLPPSFHRFQHNPATRAFFHHHHPRDVVVHALGLRGAVRYGKMARYW